MVTPMHEINWHALYLLKRKGRLRFAAGEVPVLRKLEKPFVSLVKKYVKKGERVLDAGTGLGRMALLLSLDGFHVTAVDMDAKMLKAAEYNVKKHGGKALFMEADLRTRPFGKNAFDAVVHQGILEHFPVSKAKRILKHHLSLAPLVIFSVPVRSEKTANYFSADRIERNLFSPREWLKILKPFRLLEFKVAMQRTENFIAVLSK